MKNTRRLVESRRKKIYQLLEESGSVKVDALSEELCASPLTIRRDLDYFEQMGLIERHYGGAVLKAKQNKQAPVNDLSLIYKNSIAKQAAQYVVDGDTIFINSSSTALRILEYVTAKMITVITNNGNAIHYSSKDNLTIVLIGGEVRSAKAAMVGEFALNNLSRVTATKSFLGCSGLTAEEGFTTAAMHEVAINQLMLSRVTGEKYILADHTRIGNKHNFISGSSDQITCVVTDTEADAAVLQSLSERGVQIVQVTAECETE
ncbi:MAG: DeoR/GlpR family DNA-binding transcription regulator [Bacillota bacterium]